MYRSNIFSFQNGQHNINDENLSKYFIVNTGETSQIFTEAYQFSSLYFNHKIYAFVVKKMADTIDVTAFLSDYI